MDLLLPDELSLFNEEIRYVFSKCGSRNTIDIFCASLKGTNQDAMVAWSVLCWRTKQCFETLFGSPTRHAPSNHVCVSICASVQTRKLTETAKHEVNVAIRPDSLTYLFTCGIVIRILFGRILNFYNRN